MNKINVCFIIVLLISFFNEILNLETSKCDTTLCSPKGGICTENECVCNRCYVSVIQPNDHRLCNYSQYSSFTAGLIEFLFPVGFGHLYLGNIQNCVVKMTLAYIMICGIYAFVVYYFIYTTKDDNNYILATNKNIIRTAEQDVLRIKKYAYLSQILFIVLHIIDLFWLLSGKYKDGNNISLC